MKHWKTVAALILAAGMAVLLAACSNTATGVNEFDAKVYMDGLLRETYLGEYLPEYLELVGITEESAQSVYESGIRSEVSFFLNLYGIEYPDEEFTDELADLYRNIYSHAKFEVTDAAKMDDGSFSVQVTVEPIDIVQLADTDWDKTITPFYKKYPLDKQYAMTSKEYEAMDKEYAQLVLDLYKDKLEHIGNMTPRTAVVQLKQDSHGDYTVVDEDFRRLDEMIIDYTDHVGVSA